MLVEREADLVCLEQGNMQSERVIVNGIGKREGVMKA